MVVVFDCDGVLWDSRDATRCAYEDAGVMYTGWGKSWAEWGPAACSAAGLAESFVRDEKQRRFLQAVASGAVPLLPVAGVARLLGDKARFVSLGTWETQAVLLGQAGLPVRYLRTGEDRVALVRQWDATVYVDDLESEARRVGEALGIGTVVVTGQEDPLELYGRLVRRLRCD